MKRHLRRFVPSPAMVVALTALFLALGGSAYALVITGKSIKNNTVTGSDIRNGSLRGKDAHRTPRRQRDQGEHPRHRGCRRGSPGGARFAVVTGSGTLARGRSVSSVARTAAGRYQVIFTSDVRNCAYFATIGDTSAAPLGGGSQITTAC